MESSSFKLKSFQDLSASELYRILKLRFDVFVIEQQCLYNELDDMDQRAYHLYLEKDDLSIAAYLRYYETAAKNVHLGRVVVEASYRKNKLGRTLMETGLYHIAASFPKNKYVEIEAQYYLLDFYSSIGFKTISDVFDDEGIPHIKMHMAIKTI